MAEPITLKIRVRIKDGAEKGFRDLMNEMVAETLKNEPGTLAYEWFISGDRKTCRINERYADDAATLAHVIWFKAYAWDRFAALAQLKRFDLYGDPSPELRAAIEDFGARIMDPIGGFVR